MIKNAYPELPVLRYKRTSIAMGQVVTYIQTLKLSTSLKRATYVIFRNESGSGKSGVNNNYIGLQADGARWPEKWTPRFSGTCVQKEGMTNNPRRFVCFTMWATSADMLSEQIRNRGIYVGGYAHPYANFQVVTPEDWALAYWREWVIGNATAKIPAEELSDLLRQYQIAIKNFPEQSGSGRVSRKQTSRVRE
jgi:hypothetical protein